MDTVNGSVFQISFLAQLLLVFRRKILTFPCCYPSCFSAERRSFHPYPGAGRKASGSTGSLVSLLLSFAFVLSSGTRPHLSLLLGCASCKSIMTSAPNVVSQIQIPHHLTKASSTGELCRLLPTDC